MVSLNEVKGFERKAFENLHISGEQVTSIRVNPAKPSTVNCQPSTVIASGEIENFIIASSSLALSSHVPWSLFGYYLDKRPSFTFDPLFHAGCYYVQEASSMFLEQALKQTVDLSQPLRILDLCAAPGGKSTHIQSLISAESLLVSNEVIRNRSNILKQNISKWGSENVVVTNNDPQHFSRLESFFDVLVVDAPCSGSGLFRKDPQAINEWSRDNVQLCCGRQKRIIADAIDALSENGILIYSTCSYSQEEDEDIADWLVEEFGMINERLKIEEDWGIVETESGKANAFGYRFFPHKLKGEGFYLSCFRKSTAARINKYKAARLESVSERERSIVQAWLKKDDLVFFKTPFIYGFPKPLLEDYKILKNALNVQYAGVVIGEVMKEKLVPDHALALSNLLKEEVPAFELNYEAAIHYLQKAEINVEAPVKGWQVVTYKHHNLGWINALQNRINNYYPKELRILKEQDD